MKRNQIIAQTAQPDQAGILGVNHGALLGQAVELFCPMNRGLFVAAEQALKQRIQHVRDGFELLEQLIVTVDQRVDVFLSVVCHGEIMPQIGAGS